MENISDISDDIETSFHEQIDNFLHSFIEQQPDTQVEEEVNIIDEDELIAAEREEVIEEPICENSHGEKEIDDYFENQINKREEDIIGQVEIMWKVSDEVETSNQIIDSTSNLNNEVMFKISDGVEITSQIVSSAPGLNAACPSSVIDKMNQDHEKVDDFHNKRKESEKESEKDLVDESRNEKDTISDKELSLSFSMNKKEKNYPVRAWKLSEQVIAHKNEKKSFSYESCSRRSVESVENHILSFLMGSFVVDVE